MKNQAAFMTDIGKMELREVPVPEPGRGEILVKIEYAGICGSDVHYFEHGRIGNFIVEGDFVLGHECAGVVAALGDGVTGHKIGDRVALEPGATCGTCVYCLTGRYNLCPDVVFLATPPVQGCFENYIVFPAHLAFPLPDCVSSKEGALVEPLSVGLEAAAVGGIKPGSSVVILGAGCIGLMILLAAKAYGAAEIIVVDVIEKRLAKALELGATAVVNAAQTETVAEVLRLTNGQGADVVAEAAGSVKTTQQAVYLTKRGGTIVLVGMAAEDIIPIDIASLMAKVVEIRPIFRYKNQYPGAIKALASGKIDVSGVVTQEYAFCDIAEAFRKNIEEKQDVVKIGIDFSRCG